MLEVVIKKTSAFLLVALLVAGFPGMGLTAVGPERETPAEGGLSVLSQPQGATVFVDGETQGVTPLHLDGLKPGEHRVTVSKDGFLENSRVLSVKSGQAHKVEVKLTPAQGDARYAVQIQPEEGGGGSKLKYIIPAVAGGGVAAYFLLRSTNEPPAAGAITVSPTGTGLAAVTSFSFSSTASDPDNDPLTYSWNFGDGGTGSGATATHVYDTAGNYSVTVTVSDGKESASASSSVTVRDVTGNWRGSWTFMGFTVDVTMRLNQNGTSVSGRYNDDIGFQGSVSGRVRSPREISMTISIPNIVPFTMNGELSSNLDRITGSITGSGITGARFTLER